MADQKHQIDVLQKLIDICRDGQNGWQKAAENIKDGSIKKYLDEVSLERARFAGELENELNRLGNPEHRDEKGDLKGKVHRGWLGVKQSFGGGDHSVLEWLESGEDTAKHEYEEALHDDKISGSMHDLIQRQAERVIAAHDRIRTLRDETKAA